MEPNMTPSRPYLLRAFYDWLLDNDMTPHLLVNTTLPHVRVPMQFARDGQIVLNIAPQAVMAFTMDKEALSFSARFGGVPFQVYIPMAAIIAIHARESGVGTFFPPEPAYADWEAAATAAADDADVPAPAVSGEADADDSVARPQGRPSLRVVK